MSNLSQHARRELRLAGYDENSDDVLDRTIYDTTLEIVRAFEKNNHSGYSAEGHTRMIEKLLRFQPLTELTDDPAEWSQDTLVDGTWQNRRRPDAFSDDGGKTYYSVDEYRYGWRRKIFGPHKKIYHTRSRSN
jgi:hypothetical protein